MDAAGGPPSRDGCSNLPPEGLPARHAVRYAPRRWVAVAICSVFALGLSYHVAKRTTVDALSKSCREALREKDWQAVERLASRWSRWERGRAAPLIYRAEAANQTGKYKEAVELLDRLPDADPMTPPALVVRSSLLFDALNRPIEGAETLERALALDPTLAEARRRLVYFYAFTLQRPKMVHHVYESIRRDCDLPETYVYLISRDWLSFANAYAENSKWLQGNPDEELFLVARTIYGIKTKSADENARIVKPQELSAYHQKLAAEYSERFPQNLELLDFHLWRTSKNGDIEEVTRLLSLAPPEAADDNRFWRYKGWLHAARGELEEADQAYRKALSLNCYDSLGRHQLASVCRRLKQPDQVKVFQELASEGKQLKHDILESKNVTTISHEIMLRIAQYARKCGDDVVADKLTMRFEQTQSASASPAPPF